MAANADATVTVAIDGHEAIVRAAQAVGDAWRASSRSIGEAGKKMALELQAAFGGMAREVSSIATSASRINFTAGAQTARELGLSISRMAISSSQDVDELKKRFDALGKTTLMTAPQRFALADSLRTVTYDARFAVDSIQDIANEAEVLGQAPQQVAPFATTLRNTYGVTGNLAEKMSEVDEIARRVGANGGPRALHDQMVANDAIMARYGMTTKQAAATLATLGKGLSPQLQQSTQSAVLGAIAGDSVGYERLLRGQGLLKKGQSIRNADGTIREDAPELVQKALTKKYGKKRAVEVARMTYGDVEGTAYMDWNAYQARDEAANTKADVPGVKHTAGLVRGTSPAQQVKTEITRQGNEQNAGGWIGDATKGVNQWIADNPLFSLLGGSAVVGAAGRYAGPMALKAGAAAAPGAALGATALGPLATPFITDAIGKGVHDAMHQPGEDYPERADVEAGRKRPGRTWYGAATFEDVAPADQAATAAEFAKNVATAIARIQLTAVVEQAPDGTVKGVKLGKKSAAAQ